MCAFGKPLVDYPVAAELVEIVALLTLRKKENTERTEMCHGGGTPGGIITTRGQNKNTFKKIRPS